VTPGLVSEREAVKCPAVISATGKDCAPRTSGRPPVRLPNAPRLDLSIPTASRTSIDGQTGVQFANPGRVFESRHASVDARAPTDVRATCPFSSSESLRATAPGQRGQFRHSATGAPVSEHRTTGLIDLNAAT
jgi:hypothetical protein